jgi:hypothetical protein
MNVAKHDTVVCEESHVHLQAASVEDFRGISSTISR